MLTIRQQVYAAIERAGKNPGVVYCFWQHLDNNPHYQCCWAKDLPESVYGKVVCYDSEHVYMQFTHEGTERVEALPLQWFI